LTKTPRSTDAPEAAPARSRRASAKGQDRKILEQILEGLSDIKAENPVVLDLRKLTSLADYFIVAHGSNERQVQAMAREVERRLVEAFERKPLHVEGATAGQWVLMDYGDFILHLFLAAKRTHYDIEGIWADAPRVEL
jgi:ribosome-associated protein